MMVNIKGLGFISSTHNLLYILICYNLCNKCLEMSSYFHASFESGTEDVNGVKKQKGKPGDLETEVSWYLWKLDTDTQSFCFTIFINEWGVTV